MNNEENVHHRFDDIFGGNNDDDYESGRGTYKASEDNEDNDSHIEVEVFEPETGETYIELVAKELPNSVTISKDNMIMNKNAPTKKIEANIDSGLYIEEYDGECVNANINYPEEYQDFDDNGKPIVKFSKTSYSLTWYVNYQRHSYEYFDTIQELANAMRDYRSLTKWCYAIR